MIKNQRRAVVFDKEINEAVVNNKKVKEEQQ